MAYIYQALYEKLWLIHMKIYMTSDGLHISRFVWQVMVYIYQGLYEKLGLIYISRFIRQVMGYIYQDLYDKWGLIYTKVYMTSDGQYQSRFTWFVMA